MQFFISEYCKVESVRDGVAHGSFAVPVELIDEVSSLCSIILNSARVLKAKSRTVSKEIPFGTLRFVGPLNK